MKRSILKNKLNVTNNPKISKLYNKHTKILGNFANHYFQIKQIYDGKIMLGKKKRFLKAWKWQLVSKITFSDVTRRLNTENVVSQLDYIMIHL